MVGRHCAAHLLDEHRRVRAGIIGIGDGIAKFVLLHIQEIRRRGLEVGHVLHIQEQIEAPIVEKPLLVQTYVQGVEGRQTFGI